MHAELRWRGFTLNRVTRRSRLMTVVRRDSRLYGTRRISLYSFRKRDTIL